jgi:HEAT repeat protein
MALAREDGVLRSRAIDALAALAADANEDVRAQAIEGLANQARLGGSLGATAVQRWLEDPSDLVRCAALGNADAFAVDPEATAARLAADEAPAVRATAARILGLRGAADRADALAGMLADPSAAVRCEAALALARLGDGRGAAPAAALLEAGGEEAVEAAAALGQSRRPLAIEALKEVVARRFAPSDLKATAAAALARSGDETGVAALVRMLGAWRRRTRFDAAHAVAGLPSPGLAAHVAARLEAADSLEASVLVQTLAAIGEDEPAEALAALRRVAADGAPRAEGLGEELREAIRALAARAP